VLTDLATKPGDLLVVGSRGGHALRRLMHGSVSRYCSRRSDCPVVVIRSGQQPEASDYQ
jgi:nucleotide-binding universal stress UspA family protein